MSENEKDLLGQTDSQMEFFQQIIDNIPNPVYYKDEKMLYSICNKAFEEYLGKTKDQIIGKNVFDVSPRELAQLYYEKDNEIFQKGEAQEYEGKVRYYDGTVREVKFHRAPFFDKNNKVAGLVGTFYDITELKGTIQQLKDTQLQLIQQEKLAGIGYLAAGVAHEINNPLGYVLSNFEILNKYMNKIDKINTDLTSKCEGNTELPQIIGQLQGILCEFKEIIGDCDGGLERISEIVKALRSFSRNANNNEYEYYDLNDGMTKALTIARNEIKYIAEVETNFGELPEIYVIGSQINQVLLNIVVNAAHAIKMKELNDMGLIIINTYVKGKYVVCEIQDNGVGISKQNMTKIFDAFYTTKPVGHGTGLGLSIAYDIITNKHKGKIEVESKEGEGAKFLIYMPVENLTNNE